MIFERQRENHVFTRFFSRFYKFQTQNGLEKFDFTRPQIKSYPYFKIRTYNVVFFNYLLHFVFFFTFLIFFHVFKRKSIDITYKINKISSIFVNGPMASLVRHPRPVIRTPGEVPGSNPARGTMQKKCEIFFIN